MAASSKYSARDIYMLFSKDSDVSIMITSCGRFDLLKRILKSLDKFNIFPICKVYITEVSGQQDVFDFLPGN